MVACFFSPRYPLKGIQNENKNRIHVRSLPSHHPNPGLYPCPPHPTPLHAPNLFSLYIYPYQPRRFGGGLGDSRKERPKKGQEAEWRERERAEEAAREAEREEKREKERQEERERREREREEREKNRPPAKDGRDRDDGDGKRSDSRDRGRYGCGVVWSGVMRCGMWYGMIG